MLTTVYEKHNKQNTVLGMFRQMGPIGCHWMGSVGVKMKAKDEDYGYTIF